jgi:5'-nucleotidase
MQNIFIKNKAELNEKIEQIKKDGKDNLHLIADFDNTLSKAYVNGKKMDSMVAQIRHLGYLGEEYTKLAYDLYEKYHPIEIDLNIPQEIKNEKMVEWWSTHIKIQAEYGLTKKVLDEVIEKSNFMLRENINEFFNILEKNSVPILIFSAGANYFINGFLKKNNINYKNIFVISNEHKFDSNGKVLGYKSQIIHTFNKGEVAVKDNPEYSTVLHRQNIILLGDSLGDLDMSKGINHKTKITIGFYNELDNKHLEVYKEKFDIVITNDGSMDYITDLLKLILE